MWMGISALQYAKGLGKASGSRLAQSVADAAADTSGVPGTRILAFLSKFLARFPWQDVAMNPTNSAGTGFLLRHPTLSKLATKAAVLLDVRGLSMVSKRPYIDWLTHLSRCFAGIEVPLAPEAVEQRPQQQLLQQ